MVGSLVVVSDVDSGRTGSAASAPASSVGGAFERAARQPMIVATRSSVITAATSHARRGSSEAKSFARVAPERAIDGDEPVARVSSIVA